MYGYILSLGLFSASLSTDPLLASFLSRVRRGGGRGERQIYSSIFFPRGHDNESWNLIGSKRGPDFPISDHGQGNGG